MREIGGKETGRGRGGEDEVEGKRMWRGKARRKRSKAEGKGVWIRNIVDGKGKWSEKHFSEKNGRLTDTSIIAF